MDRAGAHTAPTTPVPAGSPPPASVARSAKQIGEGLAINSWWYSRFTLDMLQLQHPRRNFDQRSAVRSARPRCKNIELFQLIALWADEIESGRHRRPARWPIRLGRCNAGLRLSGRVSRFPMTGPSHGAALQGGSAHILAEIVGETVAVALAPELSAYASEQLVAVDRA